jgi:hypothetical protein
MQQDISIPVTVNLLEEGFLPHYPPAQFGRAWIIDR